MNIWVKKNICELELPPTSIGLRGRYLLIKTFANGLRETVADFSNIITDAGMTRLATGRPAQYGYIGTGVNIAETGNTTMTSAVSTASVSNVENFIAGPPMIKRQVTHYNFGVGTLNGLYTEVGTGWLNPLNSSLFSRALIVNTLSQPIALSVSSSEELDMYYILDDMVVNDTIPFSITITNLGVVEGFSQRIWANSGYYVQNTGVCISAPTFMLSADSLPPTNDAYLGNSWYTLTGQTIGANGNSSDIWYKNVSAAFAASPGGNVKSIAVSPAPGTGDEGISMGFQFTNIFTKGASQTFAFDARFTWNRA